MVIKPFLQCPHFALTAWSVFFGIRSYVFGFVLVFGTLLPNKSTCWTVTDISHCLSLFFLIWHNYYTCPLAYHSCHHAIMLFHVENCTSCYTVMRFLIVKSMSKRHSTPHLIVIETLPFVTSWANSADDKLMIYIFLFSIENKSWHFMQIVFIGDNFHEMAKAVFREK